MTHFKNRRLRLAAVFLLTMVGLFAIAGSAQAQGLATGETVPEGQVIDNDAFLSGDNIVIDGTVDGDVLAVGRRVTVNGEVTGSLIAIAELVDINGNVGGSVYSAAATLEANESAAVENSLYFVGAQLNSDADSSIGRDLVAVTMGTQLRGTIGRDPRLISGPLAILQWIFDLFNIETGFQLLPSSASALAPQSGALAVAWIPEPGQNWTSLTSSVHFQGKDATTNAQKTGEWFLIRLRQLVQFLIVGGLVSWLLPYNFDRWSMTLRRRSVASGVYGFVSFVTGFAGVFLLFVLVLVIGIGLAVLTLRGLALATWGLGFSATFLLFSTFLMFVLFISKVIVSYVAGLLILERIVPRAASHRIWPMLLGLIIYVLLRAIPYFGLGLGFLVTVFGLGAAAIALANRDALAWKTVEEEE